ncbi:lysyl oxidase homolog 4-like [Mercenaria mercenaria]|uniref:lysyl oxidase homolog 4-like n=1 Tax=Mercenaria mercenaria TaxID=6596 RepID=UPI00234EFD9B|nr:lysyl oxidase homolog 4-like [Mercenaria mercenaria]
MYTICADDFTLAAANVSCRLLGYSDVVDVSAIPESFDGNIPMLNSSVECSGTESSLEYCNISISTDFTCHSGSVTRVTCLSPLGSPCQLDETCAGVMHSTCENFRCTCKRGYMSSGDRNCTAKYKFRFTQETSNEGLIEVNINNTWALVTGSFVPFSDQTSKALCATLGYGYSNR